MIIKRVKLVSLRKIQKELSKGKDTEVFKLQQLIVGGDVLIYNEDYSIIDVTPMGKKLLEEVFAGEYKAYWLGRVEKGTLRLYWPVEEQDW